MLRGIIRDKVGAEIDAVVDGAGGDVVAQLVGGIKAGGKIFVCFGMTTGRSSAVLRWDPGGKLDEVLNLIATESSTSNRTSD
ncbi:hypothetical protein V1515DRAFT_581484 [Lipomyces mesembrius]